MTQQNIVIHQHCIAMHHPCMAMHQHRMLMHQHSVGEFINIYCTVLALQSLDVFSPYLLFGRIKRKFHSDCKDM
jgi:hypothetical protein